MTVSGIQRNSSFELLRLMLMVMIIIHHCIVHGLGLIELHTGELSEVYTAYPEIISVSFMMNAFCICAVNCFVLLSGYFGIKTNFRKFTYLLLTLLFYVVAFKAVPAAIEGNVRQLIGSAFFVSHSPYWFVTCYLFLMVLAPMLNLMFERMSRYECRLIVVGLLIISCYFGYLHGHQSNVNGYTVIQFITMYAVGREIAVSNFTLLRVKALSAYVIISLLLGVCGYLIFKFGRYSLAWRTTYYNNPLVIMSAISLFFVFKTINFQSGLINRLAISSFGIYLFQSSYYVDTNMYEPIAAFAKEIGGGYFVDNHTVIFGSSGFCNIV